MKIIILAIIIYIGYNWLKAKVRVENAKRYLNEKEVQDTMGDIASGIKDNKPRILDLVKQAISEEQKILKAMEEDINKRIKLDDNFNPDTYYILHGIYYSLNKYLEIKGGSSREMYQVLNEISYDAEYDSDKDIATCTINGYEIELKRVKDPSGTFISADAKAINRDELIRLLATKLKKEYDEEKIDEKRKKLPSKIIEEYDKDADIFFDSAESTVYDIDGNKL